MGEQDLTTLAKRLRPLLAGVISGIITAGEGPGIDIIDGIIGLGLDTILVIDPSGGPATEYAATSAGLGAALAACSAGGVVVLPVCSIPGDHTIPDNVTITGLSKRGSVLTGQITAGAGVVLHNLSIVRVMITGSAAEYLVGVIAPQETGMTTIENCVIDVETLGDTYPTLLRADYNQAQLLYCDLIGLRNGDEVVTGHDLFGHLGFYSYGCNINSSLGVGQPLRGDTAGWDAYTWPERHASDIDNASASIHHSLGTGANQAAAGTHHTQHEIGGDDEIALDALAAPSDTTNLDANTDTHGLLPKLDGDSSHYLNGEGVFVSIQSDYHYFGDPESDGTWRIGNDGTDLVMQRRESGSWITKQTVSA